MLSFLGVVECRDGWGAVKSGCPAEPSPMLCVFIIAAVLLLLLYQVVMLSQLFGFRDQFVGCRFLF